MALTCLLPSIPGIMSSWNPCLRTRWAQAISLDTRRSLRGNAGCKTLAQRTPASPFCVSPPVEVRVSCLWMGHMDA